MKVSIIFGTRPEAIKLAPIVLAMKADKRFDCSVCVTAQHREMLDQVLTVFGITPETDLNLMKRDQELGQLTASAIADLDRYLSRERPQFVIVQGDTTTALCGALAAFYRHIPVGHVEAGLRTGDMNSPWPEEANRVLVSRITQSHFAPTESSKRNLLCEGVNPETIWVTGNTVIDALFLALEKVKTAPPEIPDLASSVYGGSNRTPLVLITGHRRESFGPGFESICRAIAELANRFPDTNFVYPVHLNPNVREPVGRILKSQSGSNDNIHLIEPLSYLPFVALLERSSVILTDSGGIQEEAPSLGKPVLVMRDKTERPEAIEAGTVRLVGTDYHTIVDETSRLLTDRAAYDQMARAINPYGDGKATGRILQSLLSPSHASHPLSS